MAKKKQAALPGLENRTIDDLHKKALEYASTRDSRMELLQDEVKLKGELLELMKKHNKEEYECEGVTISIVHGEDTIKVKVHRAGDPDDEEDENAA